MVSTVILLIALRAQVPQLQASDLIQDSRTTINNGLAYLDAKHIIGIGAPSGATCSASLNQGRFYVDIAAAQRDKSLYLCTRRGTFDYSWEGPYVTATTGGLIWRGDWSSVATYAVQDVVQSGGSSYVAIVAHTNSAPPSAAWQLLAASGTVGLGYTPLAPANNLSDVANAATARANIGADAVLTFGSGSGLTRTTNSVAITSIPASASMPGGMQAGAWGDYIDVLALATATNTPTTIVQRDSSGNFAAGTITANLTGTASGNIASSILTTRGDLIYRGASAPERLPKGSTGALLFAGANDPAWTVSGALCWDASNNRLGVGTCSPEAAMTVYNTTGQGVLSIAGSANGGMLRVSQGTNLASGTIDLGVRAPKAGLFRSGSTDSIVYYDTGTGDTVLNNVFGGGSLVRLAYGESTRIAITSTSVGIGPSNTSPSGTMNCSNRTPTTGSTSCEFQAGPGQSGNVLRVLNNAGTEVAGIGSAGQMLIANNVATNGGSVVLGQSGSYFGVYASGGMSLTYWNGSAVARALTWSSTGNIIIGEQADVGFTRPAPGVLEVNSSVAGTYRDILARSYRLNPNSDSRPTCAAGERGKIWQTYGGAGVADTVAVCTKDSADAYAWRTIY